MFTCRNDQRYAAQRLPSSMRTCYFGYSSIRRVTGISFTGSVSALPVSHLPVVRLWPHAWTSTINQHLLQSPAQTKHPRYSTPTRPCVFFGLRIYHHVLFFPLCLFVSCHVLRPCPTPSSYFTRLPECTGTEGREFYKSDEDSRGEIQRPVLE